MELNYALFGVLASLHFAIFSVYFIYSMMMRYVSRKEWNLHVLVSLLFMVMGLAQGIFLAVTGIDVELFAQFDLKMLYSMMYTVYLLAGVVLAFRLKKVVSGFEE